VAVLAISGHYHSLLVATDGFARQAFGRSTETDEAMLRLWLKFSYAVSDRWCASCGQKLRLLSFDSNSTVCLLCINSALKEFSTMHMCRNRRPGLSHYGVVVVLVCRGSSSTWHISGNRTIPMHGFLNPKPAMLIHYKSRGLAAVCTSPSSHLGLFCWSNAATTPVKHLPRAQRSTA
jgi:hypothetical protein